MATLTLAKLSKRYGAFDVLKDIDLTLGDGELLVLLGPSGCGKSTLLNLIAGLDVPSGGDVAIDGRIVTQVPPKDRDIAMVFQSYALYPNMTVAQNIGFNLEMRGMAKSLRDAAVRKVAGQLQIEHLLDRKPTELSGGQRQRVAMGRALVRDPKIFLFDEPLSNLDAALRVDVRAEIKRLHQRLGASIVYVTHDQTEALALATRLAIIKDGTLQQVAHPREVYDHPANLFVAGFIGNPPMNIVPATLGVEDDRLGVWLRCRAYGQWSALFVPLPAGCESLLEKTGGEVRLGIRPEAIRPGRVGEAGATSAWIECQVAGVESTGADMLATLELGPRGVVARLRPVETPAEGETAGFLLDLAAINVFDAETGCRLAPTADGGEA